MSGNTDVLMKTKILTHSTNIYGFFLTKNLLHFFNDIQNP